MERNSEKKSDEYRRTPVYMVDPDPDHYGVSIARVDPNGERDGFPYDEAIIKVRTDKRLLTFRCFPEIADDTQWRVLLDDAKPPLALESGPITPGQFWVEGDVIRRDQSFELVSAFPVLGQTAFKALSIWANVANLAAPSDVRPEKIGPDTLWPPLDMGFISPTE